MRRLLQFIALPLILTTLDFAAACSQVIQVTLLDTWGRPVNSPEDVHVAKNGEVFLIDVQDGRVEVYSPSGEYLRGWGRFGFSNTDGVFDRPQFVLPTHDGLVFAGGRQSIQVFDYSGEFHRAIPLGTPQTGYHWIRDMAEGPGGYLYAVGSNLIHKYDRDGHVIARWKAPDMSDGDQLAGIAVSANHLYATDQEARRVLVFDLEGNFVESWGPRFGKIELGKPNKITFDRSGNLLLVDLRTRRILCVDTEGHLLWFFGELGEDPGQFVLPNCVAGLSDGTILVGESWKGRVERYLVYTAVATESISWSRLKQGRISDSP